MQRAHLPSGPARAGLRPGRPPASESFLWSEGRGFLSPRCHQCHLERNTSLNKVFFKMSPVTP
eukprot:2143353-Lingulodinium_polyedra.AAC.1